MSQNKQKLLPPVSEQALCQALRLKVPDVLCDEGVLDVGLAQHDRISFYEGPSFVNTWL